MAKSVAKTRICTWLYSPVCSLFFSWKYDDPLSAPTVSTNSQHQQSAQTVSTWAAAAAEQGQLQGGELLRSNLLLQRHFALHKTTDL